MTIMGFSVIKPQKSKINQWTSFKGYTVCICMYIYMDICTYALASCAREMVVVISQCVWMAWCGDVGPVSHDNTSLTYTLQTGSQADIINAAVKSSAVKSSAVAALISKSKPDRSPWFEFFLEKPTVPQQAGVNISPRLRGMLGSIARCVTSFLNHQGHGLTLIPARISNYIHNIVWDSIT